jgi:hypothetical protein
MTKQREVNHNSEIFETFKQEEIEDEKGIENIVTDHLLKLTIDSTSDITLIDDTFLMNLHFLLLQYLGLLILIIFLL